MNLFYAQHSNRKCYIILGATPLCALSFTFCFLSFYPSHHPSLLVFFGDLFSMKRALEFL